MNAFLQRCAFAALTAFALVSCATPQPRQQSPVASVPAPPPSPAAPQEDAASNEEIVVTGVQRTAPSRAETRRPLAAAELPQISASAPYAQTAPQPIPGAIDRERYPDAEPNPVRQVSAEPVSTFSIDVDTASYSNIRRFLAQGQLPPRDAVRIEELINYFDYDYRLPADRARPFEPSVAMIPSPWAQGRTLLHIGLKGYDVVAARRPPLNLVLLIDVSGSMSPPDRLALAIRGFRMLVDQLGPHDRVAIVVYAGAAGAVLEPRRGDERETIHAALSRLKAGGSTAGGAGLALAYALAERNYDRNTINRVILATDGDFNVGVVDNESLEDFVARKRESGDLPFGARLRRGQL